MVHSDPNTWTAPNWHKDWKDITSEFDAMKVFSIAILKSIDKTTVELDLFEEGYMKVDVSRAGEKYAELYANTRETELEYVLYVPFGKVEEGEYHFRDISKGIEILHRCL
ncbi:hypothetical protein [Gimesia aquarii]|uniref:Uncharacterized protein n=1 Tax=Gimesia aquarii TaxID=2527964 RepID=A0A517VXF1_9PLAN|nr:hypothetical protein [Gimesia aquarii]QDT97680.1 hypothetical protein V144x_31600 [Gimesia aquarii]